MARAPTTAAATAPSASTMGVPDVESTVIAPAEPPSFELAVAELERLVASMEGGQLPLDQLLTGYRRGAELLALCRHRLEAVEQQVKVLEDGQLKPFTSA